MTDCPRCQSDDIKRFGSRTSGRPEIVDGRLAQIQRERRRHHCKSCRLSFQDPPTTAEIETRETIAREAMRLGVAGAASSLGGSETRIARVLARWCRSRQPAPARLPDTMALRTVPTPGHDRLLVLDADRAEIVDMLSDAKSLPAWVEKREGCPSVVIVEVDAALRRMVHDLFPSAVVVVPPSAAARNVEKAALRELKQISRTARASGRNASVDPRLFRRRRESLNAAMREEMEWWPEPVRRLWLAREAVLDGLAAPKGGDRDLLLASARAILSPSPTAPVTALLAAWLEAMVAGADRPWTDEVKLAADDLLTAARRCKPNGGYDVLRAILLFGDSPEDAPSMLALRPYGAMARPGGGRGIPAALGSLYAMSETAD